jgi:DcmR-like sensory protein
VVHRTAATTASGDWRDLLANPGERNHSVQLYSDLGFLTNTVGHYAGAGLARGEAVVFVATPEHRQAFVQRLSASGFDVERCRERGQLTLLDAAETLGRFMVNGSPDARLFMPVVGGILDRSRAGGRYPRVRAYGEMVNLLWEKGELPGALRLEELWNQLGATQAFSLHCAYAMDNFDRGTHCGALHGVHHAHTHLIPVEDYPRLDEAVNHALADVLGPAAAIVLKSVLVARQRSGSRMPPAQAAILGLSELLPTAADAVLLRARRYYEPALPGRS